MEYKTQLAPEAWYRTLLLMRRFCRVLGDREHRISLSVTSHDGRFVEGGKEEVTSPVQAASLQWIQGIVHEQGSSVFIAQEQNHEEGR